MTNNFDNIIVATCPELAVTIKIIIEDKILFEAKPIAKWLEFPAPDEAIDSFAGYSRVERRIRRKGGEDEVTFITYDGVGWLISMSDKHDAARLGHWVFDTVLPSLIYGCGVDLSLQTLGEMLRTHTEHRPLGNTHIGTLRDLKVVRGKSV